MDTKVKCRKKCSKMKPRGLAFLLGSLVAGGTGFLLLFKSNNYRSAAGGKSAVRKFLQKSIQIAESDLDDQNYCGSRFYPKVLKALASAPKRRRVEADQKSRRSQTCVQ